MYEKFWSECQDCYVFEVDKKFSISIDQMERAPKNYTICEYEENKMREMMHYLCHMLDRSIKQTLCIMSNTQKKPTDWLEIKNGKFFIINGQYNVGANLKYRQ